MKILKRGRATAAGLALVAAAVVAPPAVGGQAAAAPQPDPSVIDQMRTTASGGLALRNNPATGAVGFARATGANPDLMPGIAAEGKSAAISKASRYLDRFASAFGARASELKQTEVYEDRGGYSVTFTQSYRGVPVFGAEIKAEVDREGDLTSVNGFAAPKLNLSTDAALSESAASDRALEMVRTQPAGYKRGGPPMYRQGLEVRSVEKMIYRMGTPRGIAGEAKLAWVLEVWNKANIRETIILDAQTGKALNRWSMIAHALDRELYEARQDGSGYDLVWEEGEDFSGVTDEDHQNEVLASGESYWMFRNTFGRNSWDGEGGQMITINNDPRISCPNANWNGFSTNYCTGVTGDDTVAHEWGHAYTEATSGLIYQWQAGAMNEAYSDIWGEVVDMGNDRHNEVGDPGHQDGVVLRTPGTCSDFTRSPITMSITAPAGIAGPCEGAAPAAFGPVFGQTPVTGTAVVGDSAGSTLGCDPFDNGAAIAGQWVYVDRGSCTFATKAANAEAAGAVGIVVGTTGGAPFSMGGSANIYGVMVTLEDGQKFKSAGEPVSFEIAAVPATTDPTHRWLSGESDPAFGGAIRDMWNPNCYGDPGKVSDAEYHCGADDSGGVHTNSGVVNRTFAILVDGLPGTVDAIGVDKAAWLFWYSQTHFLTPTSYFPDLADALEASCAALQGITLDAVTVGDPTEADGSDGAATPERVVGGTTEADCAAVTAAIAETELRLDPAEQCAWEPLLAKDAPAFSCGAGTVKKTAYTETFEDGLAGWTQDETLGFELSTGYAWEASTTAPGDHAGGVAFAPDPVEGNCSGAEGDITSRNGLISPAIKVPGGLAPTLSFDHYVATEATWDGANVKVSVNGGEFAIVPDEAYVYNAPAGEMGEGSGPMELEAAWTGTDGGLLEGSWGTSIIDLSEIAAAGDTVNFRFDFGRDGCNGVDGWYVDNVTVEYCLIGTTTTVTGTKPSPIKAGKAFQVVAKVAAKAGEAVPTGKVVLKKGSTKLGTATLSGGKATITSSKTLKAGKYTLTVKYLGLAKTFGTSSGKITVTVK